MIVVFAGCKFAVEVGRVGFPNGAVHDVEIVRHAASVVLLPIQEDGRVVMVRQFRPSVGQTLWELPAGGVHEGEEADAAAVRECEEETGLVPGLVVRLAGFYPAPGFCDEELIFFRLTDLRPARPDSTRRPDADEDIESRAFEIAELRTMLDRGEIRDLKTAYGPPLV